MTTPKIFISYSWTNPHHEDWVINLAERLVSDGVDIVIDKWDLKEGHDKYNFMETMVKSEEINKVLIILDKKYVEKAEQRAGGVGTETQIISSKVYSNVSQEKFIPIVSERDENGKEYAPTYLEGRIYIDLSVQEKFEENYEKLLRNIYQRPAYSKPQLGKAPSYLFEETPMTHRTSTILRSFDNQIEKHPKRINAILKEFLEEFFLNLKGYSTSSQSREYLVVGKEVYDCINLYTPLRNDFIFFMEKITRTEYDFDIEVVISFLEKLNLLKRPLDDRSSWSQAEFDHFKFIIHELFLYLITVGLKNANYKFIEELLYSQYLFPDRFERSKQRTFSDFYNYIEIMDVYYKETFSKNFFSPMADFIIKRIPEGYTKKDIVEADLLCHYIGLLKHLNWFPITYIYRTQETIELFDRMISKRHFEKIKILFQVETSDQLKSLLVDLEQKTNNSREIGYNNGFERVIPLYQMINKNEIAIVR